MYFFRFIYKIRYIFKYYIYCLRYKVKGIRIYEECPIHEWFELSYAQYLTVPRSVLEAMPLKWKKKFAKLLYELDGTIDWRPTSGRYWVQLKDGEGRYKKDPFMEYRRPIKIEYKKKRK